MVTTPTLLRLGLTDALELRLESDGRVRSRETTLSTQITDHARGWADTALGIKWNSHKGGEGAPGVGWVFDVEMPTGSRAFRGHGLRPGLLAALQFDLPSDMEAAVNVGLRYDSDDAGDRFVSGRLGAGLSKGLTDRMTVSAEVVAQQISAKRHGGNIVVADVAVTYQLTRAVQLDALVGRGLTSESPKYLFTTGISARF